MKIIKCVFIVISICLFQNNSIGQDSLTLEILKPLTYTFTLKDGQFKGEGAAFLKNEIAKTHITMLGDYYASSQISNFTSALIPYLDELNYKTMVLEVGSISGRMLNDFSKESRSISNHLKTLNQKYSFGDKKNPYTPIPDFKSIEAAHFLESASIRNWSFIGIGQEHRSGYKMLADRMFFNLSKNTQRTHQKLYHATLDSLDQYYTDHYSDLLKFSSVLKQSNILKLFLEKMSVKSSNLEIIYAMQHSIEMNEMQAMKIFYEKNKIRVQQEKRLFKEAVDVNHFDFSKDKMLVKLDIDHLSKGFQSSGHYGIGNMLHELSSFHGNQALSIGFFRRYYLEEGVLKDEMERDYYLTRWYKNIIQVGQKEKWVIIDLRPLIKGSMYWPLKYLLNDWVKELMRNYELIIIPPTEFSGTINH